MISINEFDQLTEEEKLYYLLKSSSHMVNLSLILINELSARIKVLGDENKILKERYKNSIIIPINDN